MNVNPQLAAQGIHFDPVHPADLAAWHDTKRACFHTYFDQYYGGWNDKEQLQQSPKIFASACTLSCFQKITINGETVGFLGYNETEDRIHGVTIHMYESAQNRGIGSHFLRELTALSVSTGKPVYLKVFKSNPAQELYRRYGFCAYDETESHFLMKFSPNFKAV